MCHQGAVPSSQVRDLAIKAGAAEGSLKQVNGESTLVLVQILLMAVVAGRAFTGACDSGSIGASWAGQV